MSENKPHIEQKPGSDLERVDAYVLGPEDYDEIPELDDAWFASAVFMINGVEVARRPKDVKETDVTLRLDSDVVDFFKAAGADWEMGINGALRAAMAKAFAV